MLIITYLLLRNFVMNFAIPRMYAFAMASLESVLFIIIWGIGILALLSAVGLKFNQNSNRNRPSITGVLLSGFRFICVTFIQAIGWIIRTTILVIIPRVFIESRRVFTQDVGLKPIVSNLLAILVTVIVVIIII